MLVVSWFIGGIMCLFTYCYLFNNLINKKGFKINLKFILFLIGVCVLYYTISNFSIFENVVWARPYIIHLYILIVLMILYRSNFMKTLITLLCIIILSFVSEFVYDIFAIFVLNIDIKSFCATWYGYILSNFIVYFVTIVLSYIPFIRKMILNIIDWYDKNAYKILICFVALSIGMFTFLLYNNFVNLLPSSILLITNIFCLGVIIFVVGYFKEKANNNRIVTEYDQLLDYVQKYEKLIESKSKNQHEYKNQLVLIKNMISKTNKKAIEYIDNLYNEESDDEDVELLKKLQYLPNGGLKGLIYYKLEEMKDKKINFFVDISPKVKNVKINKKLDKNLKDISKVIGVYLDNAIEASINSKEKYIVLEAYVEENEWVFSISNTYNGKVSINKIDTEKFSTKGEGRGYGLSLAKDIINRSKILRQERELKGIYYTQRLYMRK